MRKFLMAAVASTALLATPAVAQDSGPYVGLSGGVLFPRDTDVDVEVFDGGTLIGSVDDAFGFDYKTGYDVDAFGGYDFGMFRLEAEIAYKRASLGDADINPLLIDLYEAETGDVITEADFDLDGRASVLSGMLNGLVDFDLGGVGAYVGAGVGYAGVKFSGGGDSDADSAMAYQLLAGVRVPVSTGVDVGLKYRYFRTGRLDFDTEAELDGFFFDTTLSGRFSSHSLLASLIFNFGAPEPAPAYIPAAAPPPPPAAPATQTCPDGTVILATDVCPVPLPPPPPPASPGERG